MKSFTIAIGLCFAGLACTSVMAKTHGSHRHHHKSHSKHSFASRRIDINKALEKDWVSLPGIGQKVAQRIIALRKKRGGFKKIDDLCEVKGLSPHKVKLLQKRLILTS